MENGTRRWLARLGTIRKSNIQGNFTSYESFLCPIHRLRLRAPSSNHASGVSDVTAVSEHVHLRAIPETFSEASSTTLFVSDLFLNIFSHTEKLYKPPTGTFRLIRFKIDEMVKMLAAS